MGVITFPDSHTYTGNLTVPVSDGSSLAIVSAPGQQPHIRGDITFSGGGSVALNGLLIEGKLDGTVGTLRIAHSTVTGDISTAAPSVAIERSICGALKVTAEKLEITESIVASVDAPAADAAVESATFFGPVSVRSLEASNSIFTAEVDCVRRQVGCVRFCCLPPASKVPRQYRCRTDVTAAFASPVYGRPEFAQLSLTCPDAIRTGAEDGSEMGAWNFLKQPQREANLRASLDEYLRVGLQAHIFFVT